MDDLSLASPRYGSPPSRGNNSYTSLHSATLTISGAEMKGCKYSPIKGNFKRETCAECCDLLAIFISWIENIDVNIVYVSILCNLLLIKIRVSFEDNLHLYCSGVAEFYSSYIDGTRERFDGVVSVFLLSARACEFSVVCKYSVIYNIFHNEIIKICVKILIFFNVKCKNIQLRISFCGGKF